MQPRPISPYSIGKYSGELYAQMHMKYLKKPIKILRPFNVFGESQGTKAVIPELIKKFLNNQVVKITKGRQTREFNYVANTVDLLISASKEKSFFNQIVNISDGHEMSIKNLAKNIKRLSKSKAKLLVGGLPERKTEIHRMKASIKKMNEKISIKKLVSFEQGLKNTINWYKDEKNIFSIF
jgi:nucleoside-diphosphate-sugar epimerase